ncbi:hypothetical protein BC834DRAFT_965390 [Gloeopeniophorella convolvens]|nr:hypothetical protein BC834DRAFT_965390 [Gloeopeniophorella convolvens]
MASSLLTPRGPKFPLRISRASVRHAARRETSIDPIKDNIRKALYPPNIANKATPTGSWRPDVARAIQLAIPSKQAHETIERAWLLHVRHQRWKREAELERKYECMRKAMDELEKIDPNLHREANRQDDPRQRNLRGVEKKALESRPTGLFPRELRVPTDTPQGMGGTTNGSPSSVVHDTILELRLLQLLPTNYHFTTPLTDLGTVFIGY